MEIKEELIKVVKDIYEINELNLFSNKGLNGLIFDYGDGKLIKVTSWNEKAFGPCQHSVMESKLNHVNTLKSKGLLVPQIYSNRQGHLSSIIVYENRTYVTYSMDKIDTIPYNEEHFNIDWGISLGNLHRSSIQSSIFSNYQYEWNNIDNLCQDEGTKKIWLNLLKEINSLEKTEQNYGLLHGDPQPNNFLFTERGMYTIDFDMMFNGFFAHDIAIGLQFKYADIKNYLETELSLEERNKIFNQFMEGYSSVVKIDKLAIAKIDTFLRYRRAMRFIGLYRVLQKNKDNFEVVKEKVLRNERILYTLPNRIKKLDNNLSSF